MWHLKHAKPAMATTVHSALDTTDNYSAEAKIDLRDLRWDLQL